MDLKFLAPAACVSALNIALNVLISKTSRSSGTYLSCLASRYFAVAFACGTFSVLFMLAVYRSGANIAQAIILMGALSILGGAGLGIYRGNRLHIAEWALLVAIALLFVVRFILARAR